jgi:LPLT family lysophospholipid transporter-like MFS transporter
MPHPNTHRMKRGFYTIMAAQFFSSLADNALFIAAVELLKSSRAPTWQAAALVPMFALFYVVLAPFVGAFADARPKGQVMFVSNAIKVVGCLMMLFGVHPLLSYAIVGLGAAAYSPAKYGILTELLPSSQLVKANGWIEGLTIASIILGILLGGQLVGHVIASRLLSVDFPVFDTGVDTAPEAAIFVLIFLYAVAAWFNTRIPLTGVEMRAIPKNPLELVPDFWSCNGRLWQDKLGQISLATTTLFWGVSGNLRYIILAWSAAALGYSTTQASSLSGVVALGTAVGAIAASMRMKLDKATTVMPLGVLMGLLVIAMNFIENAWVAAPFLILMGALGGRADERLAAAPRPQPDGRGPLDRRPELQRAGLHPRPGRLLQPVGRPRDVGVRRHHRLRHRGGRGDVHHPALARQQRRQAQGRSGTPAGTGAARQRAWLNVRRRLRQSWR